MTRYGDLILPVQKKNTDSFILFSFLSFSSIDFNAIRS